MRLVEPSGDRRVQVPADDTLDLVLEDLPGAGFLWTVEASEHLRLEEPTGVDEAEVLEGGVGAGVARVWRVVPRTTGVGTVSGRRGQSWDRSQSDRSFSLTVEVT